MLFRSTHAQPRYIAISNGCLLLDIIIAQADYCDIIEIPVYRATLLLMFMKCTVFQLDIDSRDWILWTPEIPSAAIREAKMLFAEVVWMQDMGTCKCVNVRVRVHCNTQVYVCVYSHVTHLLYKDKCQFGCEQYCMI